MHWVTREVVCIQMAIEETLKTRHTAVTNMTTGNRIRRLGRATWSCFMRRVKTKGWKTENLRKRISMESVRALFPEAVRSER